MKVTVPELLNIPPKLLPILTDFNSYTYFLLEGGRGSAKTHSVARLILYIASQQKVRVVCGREVQKSIDESVYTVLKDLIEEYRLNFDVKSTKITHNQTGSQFLFKGFREQGSVNIKGLEGIDILWIDEAQSITKPTLDVLIPTIRRRDRAKLFFTMNRYMRDDAVPEFLHDRKDTLNIEINYNENPFCPQAIRAEAETLRLKSEREYNHIYLNIPLDSADDFLFNYDKLHRAFEIQPFGVTSFSQRTMGIDFAAQGNDQCVATILDRVSNQHWKMTEQIAWDESDAMISVGKIVSLIGQHRPTVAVLDVGGMGHVVWNRLREIGVDIKRFDGASTENVDKRYYVNARANGYYDLKDWFDQEFLILDKRDTDCVKELEKIRMKFRSDGKRVLQSKTDMKKDFLFSPDRADSLMMAVWAATRFLGSANSDSLFPDPSAVKRISTHRRRRR